VDDFKKSKHNDRSRKCPVCGYLTMPREDNSFWICEICLWEDDGVMEYDPDLEGGANELSLNQYRAKWLEEHHREQKFVAE
jgi:ribosomal protein L37AE/L43A